MLTDTAKLGADSLLRPDPASHVGTLQSSPAYAKRIPELDGLRGLAIVLVLIYHFAYGAISAAGHHWMFYVGNVLSLFWSGVDLFFVLSGFLIGGILLDAKGSSNYFKAFYARRIFRIIPIYAIVVGAFYLCIVTGVPRRFAGSDWLFGPTAPWYAYATFTQNAYFALGLPDLSSWLRATWSLAVEEQFYLVLPAVLWFVPRPKLPIVLATGIAAAPLMRLFLSLNYSWGKLASFNLMPCRADALLLGVAAALLVREPSLWASLKSKRQQVVLGWIVLLAGLCFFLRYKLTEPMDSLWMSTLGLSWLAMFYVSLLLLALLYKDGWLGRALRNTWLKALGTISYGVYLFHMPVLGLTFAIFRNMRPWALTAGELWLVPLALAFTLAIASFSWSILEKPLLKIGHSVKY